MPCARIRASSKQGHPLLAYRHCAFRLELMELHGINGQCLIIVTQSAPWIVALSHCQLGGDDLHLWDKTCDMRKLMMKMSMSVDGFVCTPEGKTDWIFKTADETSTAWVLALCRTAGLHIMGSKTFQDMASYWPTATGPFAALMNEIPKAVFTKKGYGGINPANTTAALESARQYDAAQETLPNLAGAAASASWAEARVFDGDLAKGIGELKAEPGNPILAHGGAGFMRSLIATGLIDEYYLVTHPLALGAGLPIFTGLMKPLDLKLVGVKAFPGGIIAHTYYLA